MSYLKEYVLANLVYTHALNVKTKHNIKSLTTYTYNTCSDENILGHYEYKLVKKILSSFSKNMIRSRKFKRLTSGTNNNTFVRRRRITEDTPILIS